MIHRHRARRLALQCLCCLDVQGDQAGELVQEFLADSHETQATIDGARRLLAETLEARDQVDAILARNAHHWDLSRLALVDRNILRLAACEMHSGRAPVKVIIAEALRLAQEFSTAESPRFVNGVLDAVAREIGRDTRDKDKEAGSC